MPKIPAVDPVAQTWDAVNGIAAAGASLELHEPVAPLVATKGPDGWTVRLRATTGTTDRCFLAKVATAEGHPGYVPGSTVLYGCPDRTEWSTDSGSTADPDSAIYRTTKSFLDDYLHGRPLDLWVAPDATGKIAPLDTTYDKWALVSVGVDGSGDTRTVYARIAWLAGPTPSTTGPPSSTTTASTVPASQVTPDDPRRIEGTYRIEVHVDSSGRPQVTALGAGAAIKKDESTTSTIRVTTTTSDPLASSSPTRPYKQGE